jgi:hypothetical protein
MPTQLVRSWPLAHMSICVSKVRLQGVEQTWLVLA